MGLLLLLSFGAGVLTVLSPCVLPVLPFVFARPGSGRLFGGLALGFGAVMLLAIAGGTWATQAHGIGRSLALVMLGAFGLMLAWRRLADRALRPVQALAGRLEGRGDASRAGDWLVGMSTGLLWAPCAGPVLGLVLTGAALHGGGVDTALPLLAYALGAATALQTVRVLVARAGRRMPPGLRALAPWSGAAGRAAGVLVLATVVLVAGGWDARLAAALPGLGLERLEQRWLDRWSPVPAMPVQSKAAEAAPPAMTPVVLHGGAPQAWPRPVAAGVPAALPVLGSMPPLAGATDWLQSKPLTTAELRGQVVLVDFWTFACVNCQRALPYVRTWARKYRGDGLVVIGVHAPEFAFERDRGNVERALRRLDLDFPIAMDNGFAIWNAWSNQYWPTLYLIDAQGRVRWHHIGEGSYAETEQAIRQLLDEAKRARPAS